MKVNLSSHDRVMCAIEHQECDHVPLYMLLPDYGESYDRRSGFTFGNQRRYDVRKKYSIYNHIKRVEEVLRLGLDDTLIIEPPLGMAEEYVVEGVSNIKIRIREFFSEDKKSKFLEKIYTTTDGELRTVVKRTSEWPHGNNIPLFSDFNVSRSKKFLINEFNDLKRLKHLLGEPKKEEYIKFKEESAEIRRASKKLGVVIEGGWTALGDSLVWLLGLQSMIMAQYDKPDLIAELLDMLYEWEEKRIKILINEGIEVLVYSAWYEITDFWTPEMYRRMLKPRIKRLVRMTKQADVKFKYIITKSFNEFSKDFLEMGIDCVMGVDPIQGSADLKVLKNKIGDKVCLWGGINSAVTLGSGSKEKIEKAVEQAIKYLALGGGFVLYPVDNVSATANPWDNVEIMINKWKEICNYPIDLAN